MYRYLVASLVILTAQQPSIRQQAKEHDVTLVIYNEYSPAILQTIASEADTIVLGTVGFGTPILSQDEMQLFTDYRVTIQRVVKRSREPRLVPGDILTVRRWGGSANIEGHNVVAEENDFPPFDVSDTYVLFLTSVPNESFYYVAYGPQGAFQIKDNAVRQVSTKFGTWNADRGPMPTAAFLVEVKRLVTSPR